MVLVLNYLPGYSIVAVPGIEAVVRTVLDRTHGGLRGPSRVFTRLGHGAPACPEHGGPRRDTGGGTLDGGSARRGPSAAPPRLTRIKLVARNAAAAPPPPEPRRAESYPLYPPTMDTLSRLMTWGQKVSDSHLNFSFHFKA
jgi:hypothetical protein